METIEIKNIYGDVIFSHTAENNTVRLTIEEAVKKNVCLAWANLANANLANANLANANLRCANLKGADIAGANLNGANLNGANISWADLADAILKDADLAVANLAGADLIGANLEGANLEGADISWADLEGAILKGAKLKDANLKLDFLGGADLKGADIAGANLNGANLNGAKNIPYIPLACPSEGAFTAWKKVEGKYLVKLQIPEDARRSSATTRKCRCDKALVLEITSLDGEEHYNEVTNNIYNETIYKVGEMVYPDSFDDNRWDECSHGIYFFVNKEDAINY